MTYFLTIIAVSADAYFASLLFSATNKPSAVALAYAASFTFFVCFCCLNLSAAITAAFPLVERLGGLLLILIGGKNYREYFEKRDLLTFNRNRYGSAAALGLAVSSDAGASCFTVGRTDLPFVLAYSFGACAAHFAFMALGKRHAELTFGLKRADVLSSVALMAIGFIKTAF